MAAARVPMNDHQEGSARPPESDARVDVSVLVPVFNEERHIRDTVAAMQAQRFDGELEFLFADGRSEDRTSEILEELAREDPRIRVFDNPRGQTPSGLNVCLRHARGEYVARMDAHTFYPPDYLARGVQRLREGGTTWVSGPAIPQPVGRVSHAVALALSSRLGQGASSKWAAEQGDGTRPEIELDAGVFGGVWRREDVLRFGGWDEFWAKNQDSEMAGRFIEDGHKLVCLPEMGARYIPRDTLRGLFRQYRIYGFYRYATALRHPHTPRPTHVLAPAITVTFVAAAMAPRPVRRLARAGLGLYAAALTFETVRAIPRAEQLSDALSLPGVFVAMHAGHGIGMLRGLVRLGPPWAPLAHIAGLDDLAKRLAPSSRPVWAPSLEAGDA